MTDRTSDQQPSDPSGTPRSRVSLTPTGIKGLDLVLGGGLPTERTMLVVGGAGSGKTILGMEFLCRGADEFGEPGIALSFEESAEQIIANTAEFGWGVESLMECNLLRIHTLDPSAGMPVEGGAFDLSPLFMALESSIETLGAKRLLIDGINNLLSAFDSENLIRHELLRLFNWLKDRGLTVVMTGERGDTGWTRLGFEEYLADGLIALENQISGGVGKRVLQIVKCRGVRHVSGEQPFLIGQSGITLFPLSSLGRSYAAGDEVISLGVAGLDQLFVNGGIYKGSVALVNGSAGTGKTSLAASFAHAACLRGERALMINYEEASGALMRNLRSIGLPLQEWVDSGQLLFHNSVHLQLGLEEHLTRIQELVEIHQPDVVTIDPISGLDLLGSRLEVRSMLTRLTDYFRSKNITSLLTLLTHGGGNAWHGALAVSSLADTWIVVDHVEQNAELNRIIRIVKSRGSAHSNQVQELQVSEDGLSTREAYINLDGVVIGSARFAQETKDRAEWMEREAALNARQRKLDERRKAIAAQVEALNAEFSSDYDELQTEIETFAKLKAEAEETLGLIVQKRGLGVTRPLMSGSDKTDG